MKFLLAAVNAKYIHSNLALYCLRAYAQEHREHVKLAEYTINQRPDEILEGIYREKPDVVAFSCYIWNLEYICQAARELKKVLPDVDIWAGGPEVSYESEAFLEENPSFKGVMAGEGERTFKSLLEAYLSGETGEFQIPGIYYRGTDGDIVCTGPARPLDMDEIPFMYGDITDLEHRIIYYESSRGCPFSCSYCLSSIDKRVRFRSLSLVEKELQFFLDARVPQVKFVDRTFNCNHSHALAIWRYIKVHDNGITNFHFEIAADILNEEELSLLETMRPGLAQLEIGVQSTNPRTIQEIDRVMSLDAVEKNVQRIRRARNIHQHLDLIAGLPYEGLESFVRSFNDVYRLYPDQFQLGFLKVLKGSKMYRKAGEYGIARHSLPPYEVLYSGWLSYEELLLLKSVEEMVEVYYNSGQFRNTLHFLEREFPDPFAMYRGLAGYYEKNGYSKINHSRLARFDILRAFIRETIEQKDSSGRMQAENSPYPEDYMQSDHKKDSPGLYEELLTLDLYQRENSKSRPGWAPDENLHKKETYEFYQAEEKEPVFLKEYAGYRARQMMTMTHMEYFGYDVLGDGQKGEYRVLFDYRKRDALTGGARCIYV